MAEDKISLGPPRGMRDFYPEDVHIRDRIFKAWRNASDAFAFEPYDACVVESLPLLKRKAGEEIVRQIYTFKDKKGRELALRPEMTPTLARMIARKQASLDFPVKWSAIAQCFRYERMTKGRKREHYQWNLDVLGEASVSAEAEVIAAAVYALEEMGLDRSEFTILVNTRRLVSELLIEAGIAETRHQGVFMALDKKGKIPDSELHQQLQEAGISEKQINSVFNVFAIENINDARKTLGSDSKAVTELESFMETAGHYDIADTVEFEISVVRGLSYYTGLVFEAFDTNREFRALFGGGRYDNLLREIGGREITGVGLGFGDVVIAELLAARGIKKEKPEKDFTIGYMSADQQPEAIRIATGLRGKSKTVDLALSHAKPGKFFKKAGKSSARNAIYIGPDDIASGTVKIKDLRAQQETTHPIKELTR